MAMVPGGQTPGGRRSSSTDFLDEPPAAPMDQAGASNGLNGGPVTPPGVGGPNFGIAGLTGQPATPTMMLQGMTEQVMQIDAQLMALAEAAPIMGPKLGQARALLQQAVADLATTAMMAPTPAGPGFPGGGFGSAR